MDYIDVHYLGTPQLIACALIETTAGLLLVDPGPTVSMPALLDGLAERGRSLDDVHGVLLTHIHLDHGGAAGSLAALSPDLKVYVHSIGARHIIDPARLLASARRIYGDAMDRLWGDFLPVPEDRVVALEGSETLEIGGRSLDVAYTPGHAVHHISYFDRQTGVAYVGDVGGMRVTGCPYVLPVAPPPDIHLEMWQDSLAAVRAWQPASLFLTHFGPSDDVTRHLDQAQDRLAYWAEAVRRSLEQDGTDAERAAVFEQAVLAEARTATADDFYRVYETFGQPQATWYGIARYWRKRRP